MIRLILLMSILIFNSCASTLVEVLNKQVKPVASESKPINHDLWDDLLKTYVDEDGRVDYGQLNSERSQFNQYIQLLEKNHPNETYWTREESIAYWINAYNAFTVQLILDHYPVESIKDIKGGITFVNSVWDKKFIKIEGYEYDLNNIEQGILRKYYNEPLIHFAVNCASLSCPRLANFAFTAQNLNHQLELMTRSFLADHSKNVIESHELKLSKIFKWYKPDFTQGGTLKEFIDRYTEVEIGRAHV